MESQASNESGNPSSNGVAAAAAPAAPERFEDLVRSAVEEYVLRNWRSSPRKVLALVVASGRPAAVLLGTVRRASLQGKMGVALGVMMLLRLLLRLGVRGPWLWVALGGSAIGTGALYYRNRAWLKEYVEAFRARLTEASTAHEEVLQGFGAGSYGTEQRNLMIDGLLQRLLKKLDEV